ncbi:reverse transcriptase [Gossypium australe]|uniref:Reverse transcriptase n=1 Tax=Gossypium australe TaxID=47621 RepID=A0A5B6WBN2_9ROSI|nr:reverse transcriptase [Gossypium australe]
MERDFADLTIEEEEEEAVLQFQPESNSEAKELNFNLVGCFLTASIIHYPAMRSTLANLWHPVRGVHIRDIGEKRFLFQFYHIMDMNRVLKGAPWIFNNHLLILHKLLKGEDPLKVPLIFTPLWVQIHDIPVGFFSEILARQIGGFLEEFLEYDSSDLGKGWRTFMRIRVKLDVRKPLKRKKDRQSTEQRAADASIDLVLGFNLVGSSPNSSREGKNLLAEQSFTAMEHDSEDSILIGEEEKKRQRGGNMAQRRSSMGSLGNLRTIRRLRQTLKTYNPQIVFFMEIKIHKKQMKRVRRSYGFHNGVEVDSDGSKGGLCMAWKENVPISARSYSRRHIDAFVDDQIHGNKWRFTGFYGSPYAREREESWNLLKSLREDEGQSWLVYGDFNEILYSFEKKGGLPREEQRMEDFRNVLQDCQLIDVGYTGRWFTWERGNSPETNIKELLDRGEEYIERSNAFKFEAWSVLEDSFEAEVKRLWVSNPGDLMQKLEYLQQGLRRWATRIGKARKRKKEALTVKLSTLLEAERINDNMAEMIDTKLQLNFKIDKDESYWEQRDRVNWLKLGDRNTAFFP